MCFSLVLTYWTMTHHVFGALYCFLYLYVCLWIVRPFGSHKILSFTIALSSSESTERFGLFYKLSATLPVVDVAVTWEQCRFTTRFHARFLSILLCFYWTQIGPSFYHVSKNIVNYLKGIITILYHYIIN